VNVEEAAALLGSLSPEWTAFVVLRLLQALLLAPSQLESDALLQMLQNVVLKSLENTQRMALLALFEDPQLLASLVAMLAEARQPSLPTTVPGGVNEQQSLSSLTTDEVKSVASTSGSHKYVSFFIQAGRTPSSQKSSTTSPNVATTPNRKPDFEALPSPRPNETTPTNARPNEPRTWAELFRTLFCMN
jgi:hypothetical protein